MLIEFQYSDYNKTGSPNIIQNFLVSNSLLKTIEKKLTVLLTEIESKGGSIKADFEENQLIIKNCPDELKNIIEQLCKPVYNEVTLPDLRFAV